MFSNTVGSVLVAIMTAGGEEPQKPKTEKELKKEAEKAAKLAKLEEKQKKLAEKHSASAGKQQEVSIVFSISKIWPNFQVLIFVLSSCAHGVTVPYKVWEFLKRS